MSLLWLAVLRSIFILVIFIYDGFNVISSSGTDVNICMSKAWTIIDKVMTIWKTDLTL